MISRYINKTVPFRFRGIDFFFALSHGLFSSADIDSGTRLLLKVVSQTLDEYAARGKPLPRRILDSGCGTGVIGICTAVALMAMDTNMAGSVRIRAQDRDELARLITLYNSAQNNIPLSALQAHAEPLLAGPENSRWDLIVTNIPAKAGRPVLSDFVRRSAGLLNTGGLALMVAVCSLADFFRKQIADCGAELLREEAGTEHTVFVYGRGTAQDTIPVAAGDRFILNQPFYTRTAVECLIEGVPLRLVSVHGAPGFDEPGAAIQAAAKLVRRLLPEKFFLKNTAPDNFCVLVHEPAQGFFPCWLLAYLCGAGRAPPALAPPALTLSGRNILALEAARHNAESLGAGGPLRIIPALDLCLGAEQLLAANSGAKYHFISAFPELLPESLQSKDSGQFTVLWQSLPGLLKDGGLFIAAFTSSNAERFDRKKPAGFSRLGDIKRKGFRALAYKYGNADFSKCELNYSVFPQIP